MVVLLSTRPCCGDDCSDTFSTVTKDLSHPEAKNCIGCSPFGCYCIGFTATKLIKFTSIIPATVLSKPIIAYKQPYIEDVAQSIWQPPKIS